MKLLFTDLSLLYAASVRNATLTSVLKSLISEGITPTYDQTLGGIARLSAAGLLNYHGGEFELTEAGQNFLKSGKKLFESKQRKKARLKQCFYERFDLPAPKMSGKTYSGAKPSTTDFSHALSSAAAQLSIQKPKPAIQLTAAEDRQSFLFPSIKYDGSDDDTEPIDKIESFECPAIENYNLIEAFASAVYSMADTCVPRRQLCLPCVNGRSHVLTFSRTGQDEIRISIAEIRFNSRRFTGRADGDLDYAQCGDKSVDFNINPYTLAADTACALASLSYGDEFEAMLLQNQFPFDVLNSLVNFAF